MKTLAILYICTGPYAVFWHDFYPNFKANFLPDCDRTFYVFTDAAHIDYEDAPDVRRIYQKALPWPQSTMLRFDAFLGQADALQAMTTSSLPTPTCTAPASSAPTSCCPTPPPGRA